MDFMTIVKGAIALGLPDLAKDFIDGLGRMKEAKDKAKGVLDSGTEAELDAIHEEALAAVDGLIASADAASKR